jgi:hypothetical protein
MTQPSEQRSISMVTFVSFVIKLIWTFHLNHMRMVFSQRSLPNCKITNISSTWHLICFTSVPQSITLLLLAVVTRRQ